MLKGDSLTKVRTYEGSPKGWMARGNDMHLREEAVKLMLKLMMLKWRIFE